MAAKKKQNSLAGLAVIGVTLAACCGGIINLFDGDDTAPSNNRAAGLAASAAAETPTADTGEASPTPAIRKTSKPTVRPTTRKPTTRPTTKKPKPRPTTETPAARTVTPGAFCSTRGATGVSKTGKRYRCTTKPGDDRLRWRPI